MSSTKKEDVPPTPFDKEREAKAKEDRAPRPFREKRHNVLVVRQGMKFRTLVIQAKNMLKNQFDSVELHGVDDQSYLTITLVTQCLLKYKYVSLSRLKTKTHQTWYKKENDAPRGKDAKSKAAMDDADSRIILQPKLVMHLKKSADFDKIYDDFEALHKKNFEEEHKEEIEMNDKEAADDEEE